MSGMSDVIVVGGGLHGMSAALHIARRGKRVLVLEKDRLRRTRHPTPPVACARWAAIQQKSRSLWSRSRCGIGSPTWWVMTAGSRTPAR